ncbi:Vacuolar protein sorting-associated protein Ist1 [Sesbania bispinosa]|nr:Vacuolar protein sorting-associated protein Ist1 [Sesbania bispinosa]
MGKKLDALLGRTFKASKFKPIVNLAISRLAVLKNQRQARLRQDRSDVVELLKLGHHERASLRVEHVIKDQYMLDVYDKIEGYCNLLIERVHLIEQERECPEELREAASGLIYAASRCGDFPEIQEIRAVLTSRFGKEFAARAVELRNNCGVHPQMIQKLSTRTPTLESRMKALKEIASENGIVLQLEEASSVSVEEQPNVEKLKQHEPEIKEENANILFNRGKDEELSDSFKARQKYKDVAHAAQAAFESAAYAAAAARAALELSRSEPHDPDDHNSPSLQPRKVLDGHGSVKPQPEDSEIPSKTQGEELNKDKDEVNKPTDILSCKSAKILEEATDSVDAEIEADPFQKELVFDESDETNYKLNINQSAEIEADPFEKELVFDESDDETNYKLNINRSSKQISSRYAADMEVGLGSTQLVVNTVLGSKIENAPQLDLNKRPISVRTR